ncbi:MAG: hypothetical protein INQ03_06290 [Candidatus Heimdallarchaeota archaeon]|nr:hypothetical protein [Candidatus Heimdallarchaeota archaeon]
MPILSLNSLLVMFPSFYVKQLIHSMIKYLKLLNRSFAIKAFVLILPLLLGIVLGSAGNCEMPDGSTAFDCE